jgi:glycolate oxidase FAD binding subunit
LPSGGRWSVPPSTLGSLRGTFVAEVGVGIVHHADPPPVSDVSDGVRRVNRRIKDNFDPTGRLNPGLDVLTRR